MNIWRHVLFYDHHSLWIYLSISVSVSFRNIQLKPNVCINLGSFIHGIHWTTRKLLHHFMLYYIYHTGSVVYMHQICIEEACCYKQFRHSWLEETQNTTFVSSVAVCLWTIVESYQVSEHGLELDLIMPTLFPPTKLYSQCNNTNKLIGFGLAKVLE